MPPMPPMPRATRHPPRAMRHTHPPRATHHAPPATRHPPCAMRHPPHAPPATRHAPRARAPRGRVGRSFVTSDSTWSSSALPLLCRCPFSLDDRPPCPHLPARRALTCPPAVPSPARARRALTRQAIAELKVETEKYRGQDKGAASQRKRLIKELQ
eukprot:4819894-Prymnesium_polylepis.1